MPVLIRIFDTDLIVQNGVFAKFEEIKVISCRELYDESTRALEAVRKKHGDAAMLTYVKYYTEEDVLLEDYDAAWKHLHGTISYGLQEFFGPFYYTEDGQLFTGNTTT